MLISSMQMLNLTVYIVYSSQLEILQPSQQVFQANQQLFLASQQLFQASHLSRQYKQVVQARAPILDQRKEKIKVLLQLLEQPEKEVEFH